MHARPADAVHAAGARARHHLALTRQGGVGDPPAVADGPDPLGVGHHRPVEEHLVEVDLAADVAQGPHLDPGGVHIEEEVGDPLALGHVGIGAGEQHRPVGEVRPGVPHLLPGQPPAVTVRLRPRRQRRQVRSRPGLAEQLAPHLLVAHDRGKEAPALVLGAVGEQGRGGKVEAEGVEPAEVAGDAARRPRAGPSRRPGRALRTRGATSAPRAPRRRTPGTRPRTRRGPDLADRPSIGEPAPARQPGRRRRSTRRTTSTTSACGRVRSTASRPGRAAVIGSAAPGAVIGR